MTSMISNKFSQLFVPLAISLSLAVSISRSALAQGGESEAHWVRAVLTGTGTHHGNALGSALGISGNTVVAASRAFGCKKGGAYVFVKPAMGGQMPHRLRSLPAPTGADAASADSTKSRSAATRSSPDLELLGPRSTSS